MPEGHQSPPPERQKPKQVTEPTSGSTAGGQKRSEKNERDEKSEAEEQLKCLTSNPVEIMHDELERKFAKHAGN